MNIRTSPLVRGAEEAQRLVRKLPIPRWLYRVMADWGFRQEARRHGIARRIDERPDVQ